MIQFLTAGWNILSLSLFWNLSHTVSHCGSVPLSWMLSLRSNLIPVHILPVCPRTPEELKPVENKGSPDTREACVLCVAALACPPQCVLFFFLSHPPPALSSGSYYTWESGEKKKSLANKLAICWAPLSVSRIHPEFPACRRVTHSHTGCDVISVDLPLPKSRRREEPV